MDIGCAFELAEGAGITRKLVLSIIIARSGTSNVFGVLLSTITCGDFLCALCAWIDTEKVVGGRLEGITTDWWRILRVGRFMGWWVVMQ